MGSTKDKKSKSYLAGLSLAALGVVYGDIGTSPLYAVRQCFGESYGLKANPENIFGILSLIFWSLILVISFKYLLFVMKADNDGEGGILALMDYVDHHFKKGKKAFIVFIGLFGAALLYGDGMITPAISVLSAIEGIKIITPVFEPYILPITIAILIGLFIFQKKGTSGVGFIFGPLMLVWFTTLGLLGVRSLLQSPEILKALNPYHGVQFFAAHGWPGVLVLGSVFLVVTGGEALYADLGHFNLKSIRIGWFGLVLPGLMLNYLGQGALLLRDAQAVDNPFYRLAPSWGMYPLLILSSIAAIIASQAIISGVFSLTYQAVNMGYFPRFSIEHTSKDEKGQVYLPVMNWILLAATIGLVLGFQTSSNLAGAYGVAVSTTMVITSLLAFAAMIKIWKWNLAAAISLTIFFLIIDLGFLGANVFKIVEGGWFPLIVAAGVYLIMSTWSKGRKIIGRKLRNDKKSLREEIEDMDWNKEESIEGTAIYLTANANQIPTALKVNYRYNKILHEKVMIMSYHREKHPYVPFDKILEITQVEGRFYQVLVHLGFKDRVGIQHLIPMLKKEMEGFDEENTTYIVGTKHLLAENNHGMYKWRKNLFVFLQKNDLAATKHFNLPSDKVIEIGTQMEF